MLLLLLLLLPSQLALHFWPSWSLVNGVRSDYLSPTLYLTDLIILGLMVIGGFRTRVPVWMLVICVLNVAFSVFPLVSIYKWVRIYEYYWLFKYLTLKIDWKLKTRLPDWQVVNWSFSFAILWTCLLAWWQFVKQGSVGGLWYWLGERAFNLYTPGISRIAAWGHLWLRPYATLPHPNALAGFLLVGSLLLVATNKKIATLALLTVPLTFSKAAILVELCVIIFWLIKKYKTKILYLLFLTPVFLYAFLPTSPDSLSQRLWLNERSAQIISRYPLFGTGLGNFISQVASIRQPVHNIYLLIISELGLPASLFIAYYFLKYILKIENWSLKIAVAVVLATGLVDHYWITLHQNTLLLVLLLAGLRLKSPHENLL